MVKYLEQLLFEKTKDSQSEILYAQWQYDKKLIPSALQSIISLFPHYSLHEESHSITIINNIVRILGKENMVFLSAIDIWLILEAAYGHDLGMVVSGDKLKITLSSEKFLDFFEDLQKDLSSSLNSYTEHFIIKGGQIDLKEQTVSFEQIDSLKFLVAEYFRRMHAENSMEIINNPLQSISLESPRSIIPQRIYGILSKICLAHTQDFDFVMDLPFSEVGIDIENAHPRFIACLLRIGDLLDLDSNRFSEVVLKTLSFLPVDTLLHKAKHFSIQYFRVDHEVIEITALCQNYDVAAITEGWFNYLNKEVTSQMINWNTIIPYKEIGSLPRIGNLFVELKDYAYIDGTNKPRFSFDTKKALDLLQGAGLYEEPEQSIREILQNAVDSTLIRIGVENPSIAINPQSAGWIKAVKQYPISVKITKSGIEGSDQLWSIDITDQGIGISSNDLKHMITAGSSSKNKIRNKIIKKLPLTLKPSGIFGIGLQSIFMLTDSISIATKSLISEEFQEIELYNPSSKREGDILLKKKKSDYTKKVGCTISFVLTTKIIPNGYSVKSNKFNKYSRDIIQSFDPFKFESFDIEIAKIIDGINSFSHKSIIPIKFEFNGFPVENRHDLTKFEYFDEKEVMEINLFDKNSRNVSTFFKGQIFENSYFFKFIGIEANVHGEMASDVLTINRNKVRNSFYSKLYKKIANAVSNVIVENYKTIAEYSDNQYLYSMFLKYYYSYSSGDFDIADFSDWKKYKFIVSGKEMDLIFLLDTCSTVKIKWIPNSSEHEGIDYLMTLDVQNNLVIDAGWAKLDPLDFFMLLLSEKFDYLKEIVWLGNTIKSFTLTRTYSESNIDLEMVKRYLKTNKDLFSRSSRSLILCPNEFIKLRISKKSSPPYVTPITLGYEFDFDIPFPKMVSPFVLKERGSNSYYYESDTNEKFYTWVYENRYELSVTIEEIKGEYKRLLEEIDISSVNE